MNSSDDSVSWNTEYLCHPPKVSREYQEAYIIHCVAHTIMEQRDRATCTTGRPGRGGEALPVTPWECSEVNATGRYMQKALRLISERFHPTDWQAARRCAEQQSISVRESVSNQNLNVFKEVFNLYAHLRNNG